LLEEGYNNIDLEEDDEFQEGINIEINERIVG